MAFSIFQKTNQYLPAPWIIVGLLVVCFFVFFLRHEQEAAVDNANSLEFPQIFMTEVETREFDAQGKLHFQLNTPSVVHYQINNDAPSDADYTIIEKPRMIFFDANNAEPWKATANQARSEANGKLFRLLDNVLIEQQSPQQGLVQITTSEMRVRPTEQFAETDKAVKMRSAKGQIDAVGMDAHLAENRIELKSQVKAVYEPR